MNSFWNERYSSEEYIYGKQANVYLQEKLKEISKGKVLFPAEGEGRNAVFAAKNGCEVFAFDSSSKAKEKAILLATAEDVKIDYQVKNWEEVNYTNECFDAIVLIYAHVHEDKRRAYHKKVISYLKKGGVLLLEAFEKGHQKFQSINPQVGGPKDIKMLYDLEELKKDFKNFDFKEAKVEEIELTEGENHKGRAQVIRIFAEKK